MSDTITIGDGGEDGEVWPFVYLKLYGHDLGSLTDRTKTTEFKARKPSCVKLSPKGAELEITNSGEVASDLVIVEWRAVFCTLSSHKADQGFTVSHYDETLSDPFDELINVDFIPAQSSKTVSINFPDAPLGLQNVYFQARVSLLWSPSVPMDEWDFATDITVTEAHYKV